MAAEVTRLLAVLPPTTTLPLTVKVVPEGIWVTCHVPLVVLVYDRPVIVVLASTTLLTVVELADVPVTPKSAVSAEPGGPAGLQLPPVLQGLAPGVATFQTFVVAEPASGTKANRAHAVNSAGND